MNIFFVYIYEKFCNIFKFKEKKNNYIVIKYFVLENLFLLLKVYIFFL